MTYAFITGGGTKWIYDSLKKGGASKWFLGARVPYNQSDFNEIINGEPFDGKYVSERTAAQLSAAAFGHAEKLVGNTKEIKGLGVTAKLGVKDQRKGRENKIICALTKDSKNGLKTYINEFNIPNWMPRRIQEWYAGRLITKFVRAYYKYKVYREDDSLMLEDFVAGDDRIVVYSGSFNPMHESHLEIYKTCKNHFPDECVVCEVSLKNYSKNYISPYEFKIRNEEVGKIHSGEAPSLISSRCATFIEKAEKLKKLGWKEIVFAVGDDTYDRIPEVEKDILHAVGVSFLVFLRHREEINCQHSVINNLTYILPRVKKISSSEIRAAQKNDKQN